MQEDEIVEGFVIWLIGRAEELTEDQICAIAQKFMEGRTIAIYKTQKPMIIAICDTNVPDVSQSETDSP